MVSTESGASPRSVPGSGRGDRRREEEVWAWGRCGQLQQSGRDCEKRRLWRPSGGDVGWRREEEDGSCAWRQKDSLFLLDWMAQSVSTQA